MGDLHVDLISWMAYFAEILKETSDFLGLSKETAVYSKDYTKMLKTLTQLHWHEESMSFTDISFDESGRVENVVHKGYVSIFPLLLGLIPVDSPMLGHTLDLIHDPKQLWSDYGVCSLSKMDSMYGKGENYWRGPIWMPINYLLLQVLDTKYTKHGLYKEKSKQIYKELRSNIIENVYKVNAATGYVWEQYSCDTGKGQRSRPFTGWTSMTLLMMAEKY